MIGKLHDAIAQVAFGIACAALLVLLGSYLVEVVARYAFNAPTRWSSDLVSYSLCVCVAFALPIVTRDGGHVAITSFIEKASLERQAVLHRTIALIGALTLIGAALVFAVIAKSQASQGIETVAAFAIPKWWLTALLTYGLADAGFHLVRMTFAATVRTAAHEMDV